MNKFILNSLASFALISVAMNANSGNSPECDSGAYEISGVLKISNEITSFAEAAVIVNGCYTFSNRNNGFYQLRFKHLYPERGKEVSVQIFNQGSRTISALLPIGTGTLNYDATLIPEQSSTGQCVDSGCVSFPGTLRAVDPCTNQSLIVHGTTMLLISKKPKGGVIVYEHFAGSEGVYTANYYGRGEFGTIQSTYIINVTGEWNGPTSFKSEGIDYIYTKDGLTPFGDKIPSTNNICSG